MLYKGEQELKIKLLFIVGVGLLGCGLPSHAGWLNVAQTLTRDLDFGRTFDGRVILSELSTAREEKMERLMNEQADAAVRLSRGGPLRRWNARRHWLNATLQLAEIDGERAAEWMISRDLKVQYLLSYAWWAEARRLGVPAPGAPVQWRPGEVSGYFERNKNDLITLFGEYDFYIDLKEQKDREVPHSLKKQLRKRINAFVVGLERGLNQPLPHDFEGQLRLVHQLHRRLIYGASMPCGLLLIETEKVARNILKNP